MLPFGSLMRFPGVRRSGTRRIGAPGRDRSLRWVGSPGVGGQCRSAPRLGRTTSSVDERVRASLLLGPRSGSVRAGPPLPTSGGPARLPPGPAPRPGPRAAASGRRPPRRSTGCANASRAACRNWRSRPSAPGGAVLRVAGDRVADRQQVRADLVRAAGLEPHAQQLSSGSARSISKWVIASRGSSVSVERRVRTRRSRPSGASIVPAQAPAGGPRRARGTRARSRARASAAVQRRVGGASRASTSRPDVSRSRRWTTPGRSGSSPPGDAARERLGERALRMPGRRDARRRPAGLSTTSRCVVLVGDPERRRRDVGRRARPPPAPSTAIVSPPRSTWRLGRARAVDRHVPAVDQPLRGRAREPACAARKTSRRSPAASAGTISSGAIRIGRRRGLGGGSLALLARSRRPLEDVDQREDAEGDRGVGDVEGRPVRELDEVGHRAGAHAVDEVADRAAEQQPGREPDERAARVGGEEEDEREQRDRRRRRRGAPRRRRGSRTRRPSCARGPGRRRRGSASRRSPNSSPLRTSAFVSLVERDHAHGDGGGRERRCAPGSPADRCR